MLPHLRQDLQPPPLIQQTRYYQALAPTLSPGTAGAIAWEQLTYDETAHALGIPVGTVRSRLNRARGVARAALADTAAAGTLKEILSND